MRSHKYLLGIVVISDGQGERDSLKNAYVCSLTRVVQRGKDDGSEHSYLEDDVGAMHMTRQGRLGSLAAHQSTEHVLRTPGSHARGRKPDSEAKGPEAKAHLRATGGLVRVIFPSTPLPSKPKSRAAQPSPTLKIRRRELCVPSIISLGSQTRQLNCSTPFIATPQHCILKLEHHNSPIIR